MERNADRDGIDRSEFVAVRREALRDMADDLDELGKVSELCGNESWLRSITEELRELAR
jgi:hypothetical protein